VPAVDVTTARSVYVASPEGHTGKSLVALGLVDLLARRVRRVGVFRPVTRGRPAADRIIELLLRTTGSDLDAEACVGVTYDTLHEDPERAMATIVERYRALAHQCDAVVVVGSDYTDVASPAELATNARIAANLGAPVLLVVSGRERSPDDVAQLVDIATAELVAGHAQPVGVVVNRCDADRVDAVRRRLEGWSLPTWALPEASLLWAPLLSDLVRALDASMVFGDEPLLQREAEHLLVCSMNVEHILERLLDGQVCIAPGDRPEVLLALAAAHVADGFPNLAGVVLIGGFRPPEPVVEVVRGIDEHLPVVLTDHDSYEAATIVGSTRGSVGDSQRKVDTALGVFNAHIDGDALVESLAVPPSDVVTPLMFEAMLLERARAHRQHIVLPEGDDDRVLRAASTLLQRQIVDLTILGDEAQVRARAASLSLDLGAAAIVDPSRSPLLEPFAAEYARLRAHRGITVETARDIVRDVSYFATMLVHLGHADGMVSGAAHSTAHTITPAFQIIRTRPGVSSVSSVFFMCLEDRVLVYGDCAVIPEPTVEQLADIAISAAATAARFDVEPRIAMLSYSTGTSGSGAEVDKVRAATALVRERRPDLSVDGPLQYDAAVDASVASTKMPGSDVAGRASVFIFPDLNTGNNTYKAVQRSAGAVAVGPVLQGLNRPVNDLSRGATVADIVNTVAITAVQAQAVADDASRAGKDGEAR
jgi:phosphate acetyltransferase